MCVVVADAGIDRRDDGPATVGRQPQVFVKRIVAIFPTSNHLMAQKADCIIGIVRCGIKVEAGAGKLKDTVSSCPHALVVGNLSLNIQLLG